MVDPLATVTTLLIASHDFSSELSVTAWISCTSRITPSPSLNRLTMVDTALSIQGCASPDLSPMCLMTSYRDQNRRPRQHGPGPHRRPVRRSRSWFRQAAQVFRCAHGQFRRGQRTSQQTSRASRRFGSLIERRYVRVDVSCDWSVERKEKVKTSPFMLTLTEDTSVARLPLRAREKSAKLL